MRIRTFIVIAMAALLTACGASVNPVLQQRVGEWFGKSSSQSYDADGAFSAVMPYAVGQYVVHGVSDGEDHSVIRTAIVGKDGDAWIIESSSLTPTGESIMQMAVSGMEKVQKSMNPDDLDIKWVKMKAGEDEEVQKIDGMVLSMSKSMYAKGLTGLVVNFEQSGGTAAARVPAGTFNGCTRATAKVETWIKDFESEGYYHPAVPLNGMVRSESTDDDTVTELLEFGLTGAKRSF
ncbi:MAG: hypothetical protein RRA94_04755 [Bacteroidota bacterium]|nr:hypothetical protein [Bacteroidota bacterium]